MVQDRAIFTMADQ